MRAETTAGLGVKAYREGGAIVMAWETKQHVTLARQALGLGAPLSR
jgi:hypothetical protein